jgi:hypothetical protein
MAIKQILDHRGGILSEVHIGADGIADQHAYVTTQDCDPVLRRVRAMREMKHDDEFRPVAEIPLSIVGQLMREGRWNDPAAMKRWLNDPDNAAFRVHGGRV